MKKFLLVDGMALLFRGFYATAFRGNYMFNSRNIPRNGLFGFLNYFTDAISVFQPTHIICCWDMGSKTFRNEIYGNYKSNRQSPPEELIPQFDLVKEIVDSFDIPNIGVKGYEADDCIGTLAKQIAANGDEAVIVSGDNDLLQLVDTQIQVAIMKKGVGNYEIYDASNFYEKVGLLPYQIIDLKALMGDSSDNYPGVKGIGEKTAFKLIKEYESVDNLLENIDKLPKGIQNKFTLYADDLTISRNLAKIETDVPLTFSIDQCIWKKQKHRIEGYLSEELEFSNSDRWLNKI